MKKSQSFDPSFSNSLHKHQTNETKIVDLFSAPTLQINQFLIECYGMNIALWLSFMVNRWYEYRRKRAIDYRGFFQINKRDIKSTTCLKYNKQTQIVKKLIEDKVLEVEKRGQPATNHYRIDFFRLSSVVNRKQRKFLKNDKEIKRLNGQSIKNKPLYINNNIKDTSISSSKVLFNKLNNPLSEDMNFSDEKSKSINSKNFSGKVIKPKIKLRKRKPLQEDPPLQKSKLMKDRLESFKDDVDLIFEHWGNLGPPITKHRKSTKTYHQARKLILKAFSRYSADQIQEAMNNYFKLLTDEECWVSVRSGQSELGYLVSIVDFFKFTKHLRRMMKIKKVEVGHNSWFMECVEKKYDELKNKYGDFIEIVDQPLVTAFRTQYKQKKKITRLNTAEENKIRQAAIEFKKFINQKGRKLDLDYQERKNPEKAVKYVFEAIGEDVQNKWRIVTAGWLCSEKTYQVRLPQYLIKAGILFEEEEDDLPKNSFNMYDPSTWMKEEDDEDIPY